ncbi:MAG TPA: hypothetical protein PJ982_14895, partial [Lacipirellulaceae bacterium]|nr:hypothetical protein [Lacipirellulaceae bacterium]
EHHSLERRASRVGASATGASEAVVARQSRGREFDFASGPNYHYGVMPATRRGAWGCWKA